MGTLRRRSFPRTVFQGSPVANWTPDNTRRSAKRSPVSPDKRIPQRVFGSVKQKRNLCPVRTDNVTATACVAASTSVCRNINLLPFRRCLAITRRLRNDSPTLNQCSRGTLPRFALQGSHLNICYYHQDLH